MRLVWKWMNESESTTYWSRLNSDEWKKNLDSNLGAEGTLRD